LETTGNNVDSIAVPSGIYQWRVKVRGGETVSNGENIAVSRSAEVQKFVADADCNMDVFFGNADKKWEIGYAAEHQGILNGWNGSGEQVELTGKNKIADVFSGSTDANVLILTDDANGDALFLDDIFTAFGKDTAKIAQINEIRTGFGDDIVDMTSQRFAFVGDGVKVYGGLGNDTIWANNGNNTLFGDAGNDRIVGGANNDVIAGGIGNDRMHGGGGSDIFCFGDNWGRDSVEQLAGGSVTLWFEDGSASNWNASTLTYTDGENSVTVSGVSSVTLKFGADVSLPDGCFADAASEKIFENKDKGMLA
jgi:Ca2+-binding RTX toxin-like protein